MKSYSLVFFITFAALLRGVAASAQPPHFRALAFYSTAEEPDHVQFADGALKFFAALAAKDNFSFDSATDWSRLSSAALRDYQLVIWLNGSPTNPAQRRAFEQYMEAGGAWMGFHAAGYNDKDTGWPWFVDFLGGAIFYNNSWPPLPAKLVVDEPTHPVALNLPETFESPANEWYGWKPNPRLNKAVQVLLTLDPSNYPLGLKDVLTEGDIPVVWTNTKYRMVYMNMGHGDKIFSSSTQNELIENAALWLGGRSRPATPAALSGAEISPHAVVVNPRTDRVYVVNTARGTVTVIDGATAITVKVGAEPGAIAVNPQTNRIYVANNGSGTVSVIDGSTNQVTATVKVGALPYVVAANPASNKVYISRTFSNTMTVIDGATNSTRNLPAGIQADAIVVNPGTNNLYLVSYESGDVTVLDGATDQPTRFAARTHSWGIGANPATNRIYLGNTGGSDVIVIDGNSGRATNVPAGEIPCAFAVDPSANRVYVANYAGGSVTVLDGTNDAVMATVRVGGHPQAIAVDPGTHEIYVASARGNTVTVINGTDNTVLARVEVGGGPYAIAVNPATHRAIVSSLAGGKLTAIDGKTFAAAPVVAPANQ
jgi:YVTN family beta-propeller protein